jgi:hypothetical protein
MMPSHRMRIMQVDVTADNYGVGATWYHLASQHYPYAQHGYSQNVIAQGLLASILSEPPPDCPMLTLEIPVGCPDWLWTAIDMCMHKDRAHRAVIMHFLPEDMRTPAAGTAAVGPTATLPSAAQTAAPEAESMLPSSLADEQTSAQGSIMLPADLFDEQPDGQESSMLPAGLATGQAADHESSMLTTGPAMEAALISTAASCLCDPAMTGCFGSWVESDCHFMAPMKPKKSKKGLKKAWAWVKSSLGGCFGL